jgi:NAD(P)-dependent dehydrogenase (short-subunit alcohol dehydrogenase family)
MRGRRQFVFGEVRFKAPWTLRSGEFLMGLVRVNAIGPGSILTDLLKVVMSDDAARRRILSRTPMGSCGEPSEIAKVALFLASDDASYLTGQCIYPDGGRLALNYTVPVPD